MQRFQCRVIVCAFAFLFFGSALSAPAAHAADATFIPLGFPAGGSFSKAHGVSGDGNVAVGESHTASGNTHPIRWQVGSIRDFGTLRGDGYSAVARAMSYDGGVVVGSSDNEFVTQPYLVIPPYGPTGSPLHIDVTEAFRWEADDMAGLGVPEEEACSIGCMCCWSEPGESDAVDLSEDGAVALVNTGFYGTSRANRWFDGGLTQIDAGGADAFGVALSGEGLVAVGVRLLDPPEGWLASWSPGGDPYPEVTLPGIPSDVSTDGEVVFGYIGAIGDQLGYRWTSGGSTNIPGGIPTATSGDGHAAVGQSAGLASVWDRTNGWRDLEATLISLYSLDSELAGWQLIEATGISDDATTIVGYGTNPGGDTEAWAVALPPNFFPAELAIIPAMSTNRLLAFGLALLMVAAWQLHGLDRPRAPRTRV
jgi:probable HAF family extracellular repeat protein